MASNREIDVFIGFDSREPSASYVAAHSIQKRTRLQPKFHYLKHRELRKAGIFARPWVVSGDNGEWTDLLDNRTFSTEFSHTRFLVPHLMNYQGWALFLDADMIFISDIKKLFENHLDDSKAIMCVKHSYKPSAETIKMDGRAQRFYNRKNWSSFVLWNCGHPANNLITPEKVNFMTGRDLHAFSWLRDDQIGSLPYSYNFISGVSPSLPVGGMPDVIHYSDGGPWFEGYEDCPYAEFWIREYEDWQRNGKGDKYTELATTKYEMGV